MYIKSTRFALSMLAVASSLSFVCSAQQQKSRIRPVIPYEKAKLVAPPGMVYVPGGTTIIKYSQQATDSNCVKKVSLSSFFIDKCETTNQQYRQFVEWVVDSIAITKYLQDDKYYKDAKVLDSASNTVTKVRRINWAKVSHKALFNDQDTRSKLTAMLDERGQIKKDSIIFGYNYLKSFGTDTKAKIGSWATEYVNVFPDEEIWAKDEPNAQTDILVENYFNSEPYDDYPVVGVTWKQARAFAYWRTITQNGYADVADYMKSYHLNYSLPSEAQWVYAAQQDMRAYNKMLAAGGAVNQLAELEDSKDDKKAKSSEEESTGKGKKGKGKKGGAVKDSTAVVEATPVEKPATPSTAEDANNSWGSSAGVTVDNSAALKEDTLAFFDPMMPDEKTPIGADSKGLTANFKQDEGDFTGDGSPFTAPVMSYSPNDFGIYNMVGNVSEWTMDAYSPSAFAFIADINPVLMYDADPSDSDPMRRKVVRGGSFQSNAKALSPYSRDSEPQETAHCYIGFRCVMAAPEILNSAMATRKKTTPKKK